MSTDGGRAAGGDRSRKISGDSGYVADYTPPNAMPMVDQATIDYFLSQNPRLPFRDPVGYYNWMTGGGSVVPSMDPAQDNSQYFLPNTPGQFVNQPLNSQTDKSFLQGGAAGAWMLPLMVAGAGVADMGGLTNALTPATTAGTGVEAGISPEMLAQLQLSSGADTALAWTGTDAGAGAGALGSLADTSGLGYGPTGAMTAEQWLATPNAAPGATPGTTPAAPGTPPAGNGITPQAVQQMIQSGMALPDILKAIQSGIGIASGLNTVLNPTTAVDPAMIDALWRAGQQTYQTSLDPQGDLYQRTLQQIIDSSRAGQSARGIAMSPYGAGVEDKAVRDFNIDWNNNKLNRQVQGTGAFAGAGNTAANAGVANNAQAFMQNQVGTNALTTGVGTLGNWLTNLWGAGKTMFPGTAAPTADSTPTGGFDMSYFGAPVKQPGTYYAS